MGGDREDFCRHCREYGHLAHGCPYDPIEAYQRDHGGVFDGVSTVYSDADPGL
jgi:hypothetical protein